VGRGGALLGDDHLAHVFVARAPQPLLRPEVVHDQPRRHGRVLGDGPQPDPEPVAPEPGHGRLQNPRGGPGVPTPRSHLGRPHAPTLNTRSIPWQGPRVTLFTTTFEAARRPRASAAPAGDRFAAGGGGGCTSGWPGLRPGPVRSGRRR